METVTGCSDVPGERRQLWHWKLWKGWVRIEGILEHRFWKIGEWGKTHTQKQSQMPEICSPNDWKRLVSNEDGGKREQRALEERVVLGLGSGSSVASLSLWRNIAVISKFLFAALLRSSLNEDLGVSHWSRKLKRCQLFCRGWTGWDLRRNHWWDN